MNASFSKAATILLIWLEPGWQQLILTRSNSLCNPQLTSPRDSSYSPTPHVSKVWAMMMWRQKQKITETHFMTLLICFHVSTSKKLRMKSGRCMWFADKAMTHGLKSALSYCVLLDIWLLNTYHPQENYRAPGCRKLHLNIIPALHVQTIVSSPPP